MENQEEDIDSAMKDLFGITDDTQPDDASPTEAPPTDTAATDTAPTATPTDNSQEPNPSAGGAEDPVPENKPGSETTPNAKTPKDDSQLDPEEKFNKSNSAFAQMRIQNKELSDLLFDLAKASGQNPKNITEAQTILKEGLNKVVSKNRNIPEDVLREMEEDKKALAQLQQNQARQKAIAGFQQVKDLHGLSKEDVNAFADKLIENKINPFENEVDLVKEYRNLYFDELIAKAKDLGAQEERARSLKAQQNSTTPSAQRGLPDNTGNQSNPIKSVKELETLLDSLN